MAFIEDFKKFAFKGNVVDLAVGVVIGGAFGKIVSALVANVWDFISPLSAGGRALERFLAARGATLVPYPARLGLWPSTALILVWSWMELAWDPAKERFDDAKANELIDLALREPWTW